MKIGLWINGYNEKMYLFSSKRLTLNKSSRQRRISNKIKELKRFLSFRYNSIVKM